MAVIFLLFNVERVVYIQNSMIVDKLKVAFSFWNKMTISLSCEVGFRSPPLRGWPHFVIVNLSCVALSREVSNFWIPKIGCLEFSHTKILFYLAFINRNSFFFKCGKKFIIQQQKMNTIPSLGVKTINRFWVDISPPRVFLSCFCKMSHPFSGQNKMFK